MKATPLDLYDAVSFHVWKTGLELVRELKEGGYTVWYIQETLYVHLGQWVEQELIASRYRILMGEKVDQRLPQKEYLKISSGMPRKMFELSNGLEDLVLPIPF
ncbi:hypothetical protein HY496_00530 [Candidatus Woesearchaeota archaeon]|nr:hypothetical protein [Candidatus Woesearchaeota archaeon]